MVHVMNYLPEPPVLFDTSLSGVQARFFFNDSIDY
jgi:hypothetical protein